MSQSFLYIYTFALGLTSLSITVSLAIAFVLIVKEEEMSLSLVHCGNLYASYFVWPLSMLSGHIRFNMESRVVHSKELAQQCMYWGFGSSHGFISVSMILKIISDIVNLVVD